MKAQLNQLMNQELTRKEFVQQVGAGFLIVLGISGLVSSLLKLQQDKGRPAVAAGYGSSMYGGHKRG